MKVSEVSALEKDEGVCEVPCGQQRPCVSRGKSTIGWTGRGGVNLVGHVGG